MELLDTVRPSIIKVIGIGGGGCNAVNHMYSQGINGVEFVVCNTDVQSLEASNVLNKLQLGAGLTDGLGAGNDPSSGRNAALESVDDIKNMLSKNTKMVFVTAGMGGGTGTGAAPVIASIAKEMGVLTVGIVTIPFSFEGRKRKIQAEEGIGELRKHVDSLIIICNDKLREQFGNQKLSEAFAKADNVLTTAAKGIAEIITVTGYVNVDFEDVKTVMKESGVAIMGIGVAEGENRALKAAELALNSPLLNDNNIKGAKNILLYISSGNEEIAMDELSEITDYIQDEAGLDTNIIWGNSTDESLGNKLSVILVAAGFDSGSNNMFASVEVTQNKGKVHQLDASIGSKPKSDDPLLEMELIKKPVQENNPFSKPMDEPSSQPAVKYELFKDELPSENNQQENNHEYMADALFLDNQTKEEPSDEIVFDLKKIQKTEQDMSSREMNVPSSNQRTQQERISKLKDMSIKIRTGDGLEEIENEPAYIRRGIELKPTPSSSDSDISGSSLKMGNSGIQITGNSFLHDNVD